MLHQLWLSRHVLFYDLLTLSYSSCSYSIRPITVVENSLCNTLAPPPPSAVRRLPLDATVRSSKAGPKSSSLSTSSSTSSTLTTTNSHFKPGETPYYHKSYTSSPFPITFRLNHIKHGSPSASLGSCMSTYIDPSISSIVMKLTLNSPETMFMAPTMPLS